MLHQGHTYREVEEQLKIHPKMLQRFLRKLHEREDSR
jgi:hypothetical protein